MEYCENNFFIVFYRLKISDAKVVKSAEKTQKGGCTMCVQITFL